MRHFSKMQSLKNTANSGDRLIEGFLLTLDKAEFRVFVMDELTEGKRGYILKVMYGDGTDTNKDLEDVASFPEANAIFSRYFRGLWINNGNTRFCYKYIVFGHGDSNKAFAVTIMRQIVCDILMHYPIE